MIESLVDYVLERGNVDYGEFAPRKEMDQNSALFNHRKLLQFLFENNETAKQSTDPKQKRISDMKIQQISGQLNYFSQKIHAELSKKYLNMDSDLYKLQNQWMRKKIPDFYCYYFLKFAYANSYSRMHQLFLSQLENMSRQKDSYAVIKKTIEARQICVANIRKQISTMNDLDVQESLQTLRDQRNMKEKKRIQNQQKMKGHKKRNDEDENVGKSWKNKLQLLFESISHLRKLNCFVIQLIKNWKNGLYGLSQDPRRYRQRIIFFHNDANYVLKMLFDYKFITESFLSQYLSFAGHYDPFLLRPCLVLQNKTNKTEEDQIFLSLIKPTDVQMDKITKALVFMAEQQYDEDQQSRFINEKRNFGELDQRKKFIERKRDMLGLKQKAKSEAKLPYGNPNMQQKQKQKAKVSDRSRKGSIESRGTQNKRKSIAFSNDKKSGLTEKQIEDVKMQQKQHQQKTKISSNLNRVKNIRSVDLKKISPYLSRNERLQKAQKVLQLQYKFKLAQSEYAEHLKQKKQQIKVTKANQKWSQQNKDVINNRVFNKYIEENLRVMDQANKRSYLYKNKISPSKNAAVSASVNYNKIDYPNRKEAEYERNLAKYQKPQTREGIKRGTKAIIQISNKGIRSSENAFQYQMHGKKGINLGSILQKNQLSRQNSMLQQRLESASPQKKSRVINGPKTAEKRQYEKQSKQVNLFETQKANQIIIMRQQPQKIEQIKQFLYNKIKQELMEQMKKNALEKQQSINNLIEQDKRRRIQQIMQQRRLQQERRKQQQERMRLAQLQRQRKKIDFLIRVEPIQYAQQNIDQYFDKIFSIQPSTFHRIFMNEKLQDLKQKILSQVYVMFLVCYCDGQEVAYSILHHDWKRQTQRIMVIDYLSVNKQYLYASSFHQILTYLWQKDPVAQVQIAMLRNQENHAGQKYIEDIHQYANRHGQIFEKRLYSNIVEMKYLWTRPQAYQNLKFPFQNYYFGKKLNFKAQLLSAVVSFNERHTPKIDMNLQTFTNYVFLLQELFRCYLTPEQVVQLRQNSTNIRRLKDIFRIVLQLEKADPKVDQLTVVQGLNLEDLYEKLKQKVNPPYDKYFWHHFYDKTTSNRVLLSILQANLEIQFPINTCYLEDRKFLRINPRRKVLVLKSSVYSKQNIYIVNTNNPKIRIFMMQGQHYKLMRIQLFIFLNLVFNNIVEDTQKFVNSFWVPQFRIGSETGKQIKRITDFSVSMKKSFFISEEIYFCNNDYIKSGISLLPKSSDVLFRESMIFGFLHTAVQKGSTGMPLYAKLIDRNQMF